MNKRNNKKSVKKESKFIPETDVIAKLYRELIDDYGYKPSQIKLEHRVFVSKMKDSIVDIAIVVNSSDTAKIQEVHRVIYHIICNFVEKEISLKQD